jgi:hypothetical protein
MLGDRSALDAPQVKPTEEGKKYAWAADEETQMHHVHDKALQALDRYAAPSPRRQLLRRHSPA